jgi:glycosyltransferase involved in cell wall biosynthesis
VNSIAPRRSLSVAILGTRGVPARYGGFETFAEELGARLVNRGHVVTVYGRRGFFEKADCTPYRGIARRSSPTLRHKYLETPLHGLTSFLDLFRRRFDIVLLCNAANSPFAFLVRLRGLPLLINVDGIERMRGKWNSFGRAWYRLGEWSSVRYATRVIADAKTIDEYYREHHRCETSVIAYGADAPRREPGPTLARFGLAPRGYLLYVSRLEPENNARGVIEAYGTSGLDLPLVIVGDAPYAERYIASLHEAARGRNVVFTGFQFGESYQELQSNCFCYIQATEVGGTHPALIEAMAYGNCVVANGTPENIEVLGDAGAIYPKNDFPALGRLLQDLAADPARRAECAARAAARAAERYEWDAITSQYEELFFRYARKDEHSIPVRAHPQTGSR